MSIQLYPDHKAILHFYDSLKVYEVDFLDALTAFLAQDAYGERHFDIYVKPTLFHSACDFIIVEPNQKIYIIQTPESADEYVDQKEKTDAFFKHYLASLSPTLSQNIEKSAQANEDIQKALIKQLFYVFDDALFEELLDIKAEEDVLLSVSDFEKQSTILEGFFVQEEESSNRLTRTESYEIKRTLNPNTNIKNYIPKSLPKEYHAYILSRSQSKQKFKGPAGYGKSILLAKRATNSSNRLKHTGKILVIAGDETKVLECKDLITAESGKSLQELGIDVSSYSELALPAEKYRALFIDDAHLLTPDVFYDLLKHYVVEMTDENDYEYVVMADDTELPKVPNIFGPFITLKFDLKRMTQLLNKSRDIFLSILEG